MFSSTTIASSTTLPTATASPPRVRMLIVTPVICITTRAVRIDSGMLIAATTVARRLSRNRKIVMIANSAPRPPSRSRPSRDSLMKTDRSWTVVIVSWSACSAAISASLALTASATSTVLASEVFDTVRVERRVAVRPAVAGGGDLDELDRADIGDGHRRQGRRCAGLTDDERADLLGRGEAADGRDRGARAVGRDLARRDGQVVGGQRGDHLLRGDAARWPAWSGRG